MRAALRHARGPDWRDAGHQAESRVAGRRCRQARAHTTRGCRPGRPGRLRSPPSRRARFRARRRRARETRQLRETVRVRVGGVRGESRGPRGGPRGALGRCATVRPRQVRPPDTSPDSVPRHLRTLRATARAARGAENAVRPRVFLSAHDAFEDARAADTHPSPPSPPSPPAAWARVRALGCGWLGPARARRCCRPRFRTRTICVWRRRRRAARTPPRAA